MLVSPSWTSVKPGRGRVRSFKGGSITTTGTGGMSCHADHMFTNPSRTTLVAFTVGEKYQPGGEFKVSLLAKFKEEKYLQHLK